MEVEIWKRILCAVIVTFIGISYGLFLGGVSRKLTARMQNRRGPSIWQNFFDVWKLFRKKSLISHGVMYYLGPVFRFIGGVGMILLIPITLHGPCFTNFSFIGDLFVILYFMFLGCLGMALGAGESGHPHAVIGVSRGLALMTANELPFILAVVTIMASTGSTSLKDIIIAQHGGILHWNLIRHPFASAAAFLSFLGMMGSYPFSVVLAPQEIPVGPPTEYSSTHLSFMFSGRSVFAVAKYLLFMDLFLGGAANVLVALVKTFVIFLWPLFITDVFPRYRLEQAVRFFWIIPTLLGLTGLLIAIF